MKVKFFIKVGEIIATTTGIAEHTVKEADSMIEQDILNNEWNAYQTGTQIAVYDGKQIIFQSASPSPENVKKQELKDKVASGTATNQDIQEALNLLL